MENNNKKKKSLFDIILYIYMFGVIVYVLWGPSPYYRRGGHTHSREKACYSNIRVIQGAIEMYNMDHETMISSLSDSETQNPINLNGYLKAVSHPELQCSYQGSGLGDGDGGVWCTYHGDVDGTLGKQGTYRIKQESFLNKIKIETDISKYLEKLPYAFFWPILLCVLIPILIFSGLHWLAFK